MKKQRRQLFCFLTVCGISAVAGGVLTGETRAESAEKTWKDAIVIPLKDSKSTAVGEAKMLQTSHGALLRLELANFPPGTHALHIHEVGKCDPPAFTSAGDHFNPADKKHGMLAQDGRHAGDLPNIHVPDSGTLVVETFAAQLNGKEKNSDLFDSDGAALVIHTGADDYRSDPAGNAGERIACGVIPKPTKE